MSTAYTKNDISHIAKDLKEQIRDCDIVTFSGSLGAGKTTLIKELFKQFGIKHNVTSPTFAYMNQYVVDGFHYYHFDLYRVNSLQEFCAAGFEEYLCLPQSKVFIEWPEQIGPLLKGRKVCMVSIGYGNHEDERVIDIKRPCI